MVHLIWNWHFRRPWLSSFVTSAENMKNSHGIRGEKYSVAGVNPESGFFKDIACLSCGGCGEIPHVGGGTCFLNGRLIFWPLNIVTSLRDRNFDEIRYNGVGDMVHNIIIWRHTEIDISARCRCFHQFRVMTLGIQHYFRWSEMNRSSYRERWSPVFGLLTPKMSTVFRWGH